MLDIAGLPEDVRYCAWREDKQPRVGILTKDKARNNDPSTWITREAAETLVDWLRAEWDSKERDHPFTGGLGIFLGLLEDKRVLCGFDLDSCLSENGLDDWAAEAVSAVPGYWEISPSGRGIKLFAIAGDMAAARAALELGDTDTRSGRQFKISGPKGGHPPGMELYLARRYFTLTGNALYANEICAISAAQITLLRTIGETLVKKTKDTRGPIVAAPILGLSASSTLGSAPSDDDGREGMWRGLEALSSDWRMGTVAAIRLRRLWSGDLGDLGDDRSRSAIAFRLGAEMANVGFAAEEIAAAVCAHGLTADWAAEKGMVLGEREMTRLLAHARPTVSFRALPVVEGLSSSDPAPKRERPKKAAAVGAQVTAAENEPDGLLWPADGGRPIVRLRVPLHETVLAAEEAVEWSRIPIMHRGQRLVRPVMLETKGVGGRDTAMAALQELTLDDASRVLSEAARWIKWDARSNGWVACDPSPRIAATWLSKTGLWRAPHVAGIITTPTLRWNGTVLGTAGLDAETGLYLMSDPGLNMPVERKWESGALIKADAEAALELLDGLLDEFPFAGAVDRSVALSAIITLVARGALRTRPMHVINAHEAGTGKTFLVDVITMIALGRTAPLATPGKTEEETEKRLGAMLMAGIPVGVLDNVTGALGGALLSQAITQESLTIRVLGVSKMPIVENSMSLLATGNNITITGDLVRRSLECRLDADTDEPETREFSGNPLAAVLADRGVYVAAALTVARAHALAGYPGAGGIRPLASFEDWTRTVRGALVWLGRADPVEAVSRTRRDDPERNDLGTLTRLWEARFGRGPEGARSIREALDTFGAGGGPGPITSSATITPMIDMTMEKLGYRSMAEASGAFREVVQRIAGRSGVVDPIRLALWFTRHEGRVVGILRFMKSKTKSHANVNTWTVERAKGRVRAVEEEKEL